MTKKPLKIKQQAIEPDEQRTKEDDGARAGRLQALGGALKKKRDEAIDARRQSGIEDEWIEDEEHYEGIDDANRDLYRNRGKPLSPEGGSDLKKDQTTRSRVFLNITRPYVDAAAAKVADMLLPTDDQNWGIQATPIPSLVKNKNSKEPLLDPSNGQPSMAVDANGQPKPMTVGSHVKIMLEQATQAAKEAETRIDDWLTESNYNHETRKVIEKCARLGTGVIKGPYPVARTHSSVSKEGGATTVKRELKLYPESRMIDPWDFYPDPACGNDIPKGSYTWEKNRLTKRGVEELLKDDSYLTDMLQTCLIEGPQKILVESKDNERQALNLDNQSQYEVWYYTGFISPQDMEDADCPCDNAQESIPAIVVMINDYVVKAAINPLDSGAFPYDVMTWQERDGHWAGIGVARQVRTPQRILNAGVRNVMDNAGLMSGPQIVVNRSKIEPADGQWSLSPRKIWYMLEDAVGSVQEAFTAINIPAMQEQLFAIIQFAIKMAEDVTGLPMLLQGQQGQSPETVGGMQMLNNNASTVMRRIARTYDDKITEPHIRRYYEWLLLDTDVPETEKGDYKIVARGSSALVERDIQNQAIVQMGAMVLNPAFGINPRKWIEEYYKSQRLDPKTFLYSEDELAKMAEQQAANPPQDPNQIRAQAMVESSKVRSDAMVAVSQADVAEKQTQRELDLQEAREDRQFRLELARTERESLILKLSYEEKRSIQQIKADLAKTAIVEKNKREIFNAEKNLAISTGSGI